MSRSFRPSLFLPIIALLVLVGAWSMHGCGGASSSEGNTASTAAPKPQGAGERRVRPLSAEEIQTSLIAAERLFDGGALSDAEAVLRALLDRVPDDLAAREMLARVIFHRAAEAKADQKTDVAERLYLEAYERYLAVLELDPANVGWHQNAGDFALTAGRNARAIGHYLDAERLDPTNPRHPLFAAQLLLREMQLDEAAAAAERALQLDSDSAHALATLAAVHMERDEHERAFDLIREAREVARTEEALHLRVMEARFCRLIGEPGRALALLLVLDADSRGDPLVAEELARSFIADGRPEKAVDAWTHCYEYSRHWRAALGAAKALIDADRPRQAAHWLAIARAEVGWHPEVAEVELQLDPAREAK